MQQNEEYNKLPPNWSYLRTVRDTYFRTTFNKDVQDFHKLREECLKENKLFEDLHFPCTKDSLKLPFRINEPIEWIRPKDIPGVVSPKLIDHGISRFDVVQGALGDCWFLSTLASVALHPELMARIIPNDQSFEKGEYAGIFHFQFWKAGCWVDVVVDDRLPVLSGKRRLAFDVSSETSEFWSALLEKAYAKFYGSYGALDGGFPSEAMGDLTGGTVLRYSLKDMLPNEVFSVLNEAFHSPTVVACGIMVDSKQLNNVGLSGGHAYSVTDVLAHNGGADKLVRIRNPHGYDAEWRGAWSDGSVEWRGEGPPAKEDGEFWMSVSDFVKYFDLLEVCHYVPPVKKGKRPSNNNWCEKTLEGAWEYGLNAGGLQGNTYHRNPQYRFVIEANSPDQNDVIIALVQLNRRYDWENCLPVGFYLYLLEDPIQPKQRVSPQYLKFTVPYKSGTKQFSGRREECAKFTLKPGSYCVVPCSSFPASGEFVLRILYRSSLKLKILRPSSGLPAPTGKRKNIYNIYYKASKYNHEINWKQLQVVLRKAFKKNRQLFQWASDLCNYGATPDNENVFSESFCQELIRKYSASHEKTLTFEEFLLLWEDVSQWKKIFLEFDQDNSGYLTIREINEALMARGMDLGLIQKSSDTVAQNPLVNQKITFEDSVTFALQINEESS